VNLGDQLVEFAKQMSDLCRLSRSLDRCLAFENVQIHHQQPWPLPHIIVQLAGNPPCPNPDQTRRQRVQFCMCATQALNGNPCSPRQRANSAP